MLRSCEHLDDLFEGGGSLVGRFAGVSVRKMTRTKRMEDWEIVEDPINIPTFGCILMK